MHAIGVPRTVITRGAPTNNGVGSRGPLKGPGWGQGGRAPLKLSVFWPLKGIWDCFFGMNCLKIPRNYSERKANKYQIITLGNNDTKYKTISNNTERCIFRKMI